MEGPKSGSSGSSSTGRDGETRKGTRRRRALLNLGMPFVQVDEFLNQAEDAVAVGYKVLQQVVDEIKRGYKEAQDFNDLRAKDPTTPIPWEQVIDRVQNLQNIAFDAAKKGTDIAFDSMRSGLNSGIDMAKTFAQSRKDVETGTPKLAGPVFVDPIVVSGKAGTTADKITRSIRHRGLTRLRIHVKVDPPLKKLIAPGSPEKSDTAPFNVGVGFGPASEKPDEEFCVLTVDVGMIPPGLSGDYEGMITASNFDLIIAKLRVRVAAADASEEGPRQSRRHATQDQRRARARRAKGR